MAQFARPNSDDDNSGSWSASSGSSLYAMLDETSASDSDYITVTDYGSGSACTLGLSSVADPSNHGSTSVFFRAWTDSYYSSVTVNVNLRQGSSSIKSQNFTPGSSYSPAHEMTLSTSEAADITDYTDLNVVITATDGMWMGSETRISHLYFTCPELGPLEITPAHASAAATAVFNQLTINPVPASAASSASSDNAKLPAPASAASSAHVGTVSVIIPPNEVTPAHAASSASAVMNTVTKSSVVALAQAAAVMTTIAILPLPASSATSGTLTPFPKVITPAFAAAATSAQGTGNKLFADLPGTLVFDPSDGNSYENNTTLKIHDRTPSGTGGITYSRINSTRQKTELHGDGDTTRYIGLILFDLSSIASSFKSDSPFAHLDISLHHRTGTEIDINESQMSNHRLQGWAYKLDPSDYNGNVGANHDDIPDADLAGTSLRTTASSYLDVSDLLPFRYTGGPAAYKLTIEDFEDAFNEVIEQFEWDASDKHINVGIEWTATHSSASSYYMNWWHNQISGDYWSTYPTTLDYRLWIGGEQITPSPASAATTGHTNTSVNPAPASAATSASSDNAKFPAPASAATSVTLSALSKEITPAPAIAASSATSIIAKLPLPATAAAVADRIVPIVISDPITSMTHYVNDRVGVFLYQKSDGEIMTNTGYGPVDAAIPASGTITSLDHYLSTGYLGITLFQQGDGTIKHRTGYGSLTPTPIPSSTVGSMDAIKSTDGSDYIIYQDDAGRIKYRT